MPGAVVPRLRASELVSDQHAGFPNALQPEPYFCHANLIALSFLTEFETTAD